MATSYSNTHVSSYTTVDTAPNRYQTITGTITSVGRYVTGTGTLFLSEIGGDAGVGHPTIDNKGYIFNGTTEVREIQEIIDDTHLVLCEAFTVDLAGAAVKYVPESRTMQMSWVCISAGGKVDNVTLAANEGSGSGYTASVPSRNIQPIVIDGSGGQIDVTIFTGN
jgi:hypothetical protein